MRVKPGRVGERLDLHMAEEGYVKSKKSKTAYILDKLVYSHANSFGSSDNLKTDVNCLMRCHVLPIISAPVLPEDTFTAFSVCTLAPIEVFASKIKALTERGAVRDLYGLNNLSRPL
jgi:predicted nucleotidyltransferase component of viral defense system